MKLMGAGSGATSTGSQLGRNAYLMFNATKCVEIGSHGTNALHVCSFCLAAFNAEHDHPVVACNKRLNFKRGRDRGYNRGEKENRYDAGHKPAPRRQNQEFQYQNKGWGTYGQYFQPRFQNPPPPTTSKLESAPAN